MEVKVEVAFPSSRLKGMGFGSGCCLLTPAGACTAKVGEGALSSNCPTSAGGTVSDGQPQLDLESTRNFYRRLPKRDELP